MEKEISLYKQCVKQLLSTYQPLETDQSKVELLFDDERMRYMAIRIGWFKQKRIHLCLVHIDICDEAIIIQANNTEDMIASELVELGVPREKILLGFLPSHLQSFTALSESSEQMEPA